MDNAAASIVLLAFQPFFFMLSFSALTEPLAALLLAASLHAVFSRRYLRSAVYASLLPLARLELSLLLVIWAIQYLRSGRWRSILVLPLGLIAWNLAGALMTRDPLYLYNNIFTGTERFYDAFGLWHYPSTFIFIAGPVVFAFVVMRLARALWRRALDLVHFGFFSMFLGYMLLSWKLSVGQAAGFLRHVTAISPLTALIALEGVNDWMQAKRNPWLTLGPLAGAVVVTGVFLSRKLSGGLQGTGPVEHWKLAIVVTIALVAVARHLFPHPGWQRRSVKISMLTLITLLSIAHLGITERPIRLTAEQEVIKATATWYRDAHLEDRVTLCNHGWFHLFAKNRSPFFGTLSQVDHANPRRCAAGGHRYLGGALRAPPSRRCCPDLLPCEPRAVHPPEVLRALSHHVLRRRAREGRQWRIRRGCRQWTSLRVSVVGREGECRPIAGLALRAGK
jgi:hypothetical protein